MDTFLCDRCQLVTPRTEYRRLTIPHLSGMFTDFHLCACCATTPPDVMKEWVRRQMTGHDEAAEVLAHEVLDEAMQNELAKSFIWVALIRSAGCWEEYQKAVSDAQGGFLITGGGGGSADGTNPVLFVGGDAEALPVTGGAGGGAAE